jgi:hypothetical protein
MYEIDPNYIKERHNEFQRVIKNDLVWDIQLYGHRANAVKRFIVNFLTFLYARKFHYVSELYSPVFIS